VEYLIHFLCRRWTGNRTVEVQWYELCNLFGSNLLLLRYPIRKGIVLHLWKRAVSVLGFILPISYSVFSNEKLTWWRSPNLSRRLCMLRPKYGRNLCTCWIFQVRCFLLRRYTYPKVKIRERNNNIIFHLLSPGVHFVFLCPCSGRVTAWSQEVFRDTTELHSRWQNRDKIG